MASNRLRTALPACLAWSLAATAVSCASDPGPPPSLPGSVKVPASQFPPGTPAAPAADPGGPVTHLGRHVFPKCHRMAVVEIVSVSRTSLGAEIARVREAESLWGPPEDPEVPYNVICGESGLAPAPGARALVLLRLLPAGGYEAVEIAPAGGDEGEERLRAFRMYLRIEGISDPAHRRSLLLGYLRAAIGTSQRWTRANAVREYAAFSDAFPGALGHEDATALSRAIPALRDSELRRLAQRALDSIPAAGRTGRAPASSGSSPGSTSGPAASRPALSEFESRFADPKADAAARRNALLDAAARLDREAIPLVVRALGDRDAVVREAAVVAASEIGARETSARVLEIATLDESAPVRRSAVTALGHLRVATAVPFLAGLAVSAPDISRDALFSLARIRDDAAMANLRTLRERLGPDARKDIDFLLSDDFVTQEKALGARWTDGR